MISLSALFAYSRWADARLLPYLQPVYADDAYTQRLMSHVVIAQAVWLDRIAQVPLRYTDFFQVLPWPDLIALERETTEALIQLPQRLDAGALAAPLEHSNAEGRVFRIPLEEVLFHVANHGTHHRAQLLSQLRRLGHTPPDLSFILYARERHAPSA
ncbi:MAG: DinB family protein [Bacteroidetes bacterium]|jgi:uncharacterized damage-inducible protein DinB|nr:DinB family protein [Bacteroidota bacterium]